VVEEGGCGGGGCVLVLFWTRFVCSLFGVLDPPCTRSFWLLGLLERVKSAHRPSRDTPCKNVHSFAKSLIVPINCFCYYLG